MGMKIFNHTPTTIKFRNKSLLGIALGDKVVWPVKDPTLSYTITVGINPTDVSRVQRIEATGDIIDTAVSAQKDSYIFTVVIGSNCTIKIIPAAGYLVDNLNVNTVGQGSVNSYDFNDVRKNHTAYLWMKEASIESSLVYKRSDVDIEYTGLEKVVQSVVADFPDGLTLDIKIICIGGGVDFRGDDRYSLILKNWNKDTPYSLTLDGGLISILDGRGFGGIYIEECSNIIIRNFIFQNFNTYEGIYVPEETACVYALNKNTANPCYNIYIENCTVKGQSTISPGTSYKTRYAFTAKGYENVNIVNCTIKDVCVKLLRFNSVKIVNIILCNLSGDMQSGIVGHPYMTEFLSCIEVNFEDCNINAASFNEAVIFASNVDNINIKRNKIYNAKGQILNCSNLSKINSVCIDNNYLHDNLMSPLFSWECNWLLISNAKSLVISNNLVVFSSTYFQEFFLRSEDSIFDSLVSVNNIFIRKNSQNHGIILIGDALEKVFKNNIYKLNDTLFLKTKGVSSSTGRSLDKLKELGLEENSGVIPVTTSILISDTGGTRNCLSPLFAEQYKSDPNYVSEFDLTYKKNDSNNSSIGCENLYAQAFDEFGDTTQGYDGTDLTDSALFSNEALYSLSAENILLLKHRTKIRSKFIKYTAISSSDANDKKVFLGKYTILSLLPIIDDNGEYVSDKLYTIKID